VCPRIFVSLKGTIDQCHSAVVGRTNSCSVVRLSHVPNLEWSRLVCSLGVSLVCGRGYTVLRIQLSGVANTLFKTRLPTDFPVYHFEIRPTRLKEFHPTITVRPERLNETIITKSPNTLSDSLVTDEYVGVQLVIREGSSRLIGECSENLHLTTVGAQLAPCLGYEPVDRG
jgi:hypothetical protein